MHISSQIRKTAIILAFTIAAGVFAQGPGVEKVFAADPPSLTLVHEGVIMKPGQNVVPVHETFSEMNRNTTEANTNNKELLGDIDTQLVMMLPGLLSAASGLNAHTISYPLDDGVTVDLNITRRAGTLGVPSVFDVSYTLTSSASGGVVQMAIDDPGTDFQIYLGGAAGGYLAASPSDPNFLIPNESVNYGWARAAGVPKFTINPTVGSNGFSFKFANRTVHFVLENDIFWFATDGIQTGRVYEFKLTGGMNNAVKYYAYPLPQFMPYSHAPTSAIGGKYSRDVVLMHQNNPYEILESKEIPEDIRPGAATQQLDVTFPYPLDWNAASRAFEQTTEGVSIDMSLELIDIKSVQQQSFRIRDARNPALRAGGNIESVPNTKITGLATNASGYTLTLDEMKSGQIFRGTVRGENQATGDLIMFRPTYPEFGSAYTLLEYTMIGETMKIWPYEGVQGTYVIGAVKGGGTFVFLPDAYPDGIPDDAIVTKIPDVIGTSAPIGRAIPTDTARSVYYRVVFILSTGIKIPSQASWAQLIPDSGLKVPTELFASAGLSRKEDWFTGEKGELALKLRWDLGAISRVDNLLAMYNDSLVLTYDFAKALGPITGDFDFSDPFAALELEITSDTNPITTGSGLVAKWHRATSDALDLANNIRSTDVSIVTEMNMLTGARHYYIDATLNMDAFSTDYDGGRNAYSFLYPNVYFAKVRLVKFQGQDSDLSASPADSFTLDSLAPVSLSPPQNPDFPASESVSQILEDKTEYVKVGYNFDMPTQNLFNYQNYYAPELTASLFADFRLNFYISQSTAALNEATYADTDGVSRRFYELSPEGKRRWASVVQASGGAGSALHFSRASNAGAAVLTTSGGQDAREVLRQGKVLMIEGVAPSLSAGAYNPKQHFVFEGLDANQQYAVYAELVSTLKENAGGQTAYNKPAADGFVTRAPLIHYSGVSKLASVTTKGYEVVPSPEEKTPSAPSDFAVRSVEYNNAELQWTDIEQQGETIEYELLRIRNDQLDKDGTLLNDRSKMSDLWAKLPSVVRADAAQYPSGNHVMRTDGSSGRLFMMRYNPSAGVYGPAPADASAYSYRLDTDGYLVYKDNTLLPNQIYFYYLRAVKVNPNGDEVYSNWVEVTLTTDPVQPPTNLRIEQSRPGQEYDLETQIMFSFESRIPPSEISAGLFSFHYELKKDGESWTDRPVMDVPTLNRWVTQIGNTGRYKYMYIVSGLDTDTSYSLRVFAQDAAKNKSRYTDPVMFKTEVDPDEYDRKEELESWQKYFRELLEQLLRDPYWSLYDTPGRLESVYRPTMFHQLVVEAMDANITLRQGEGGQGIYYLPSGVVQAADNANKGFRIVHDNVEFIIPPRAFDMDLNPAITDAEDRIREGTIDDYYIVLTVNRRYIGAVGGGEPATLENEIRFGVLESEVTAEKWDKDMFNLLAAEVERIAKSSGILDDIEDQIVDKEKAEEIIKFLEAEIEDIKDDFSDILEDEFEDVTRSEYRLPIDSSYTVIGKDKDDVIVGNGYEYLGGSWVQRETIAYGNGQAMQPTAAGTFIFAGRVTVIGALVDTPDGALITSLIYKYNLEDFLGMISYSSLEQYANRDMLAGAVARIAGAPRGSDPFAWLNQNKKMTLSTRNGQTPIELQEALYLLTALYEFKTNKAIATIQIRNYAVTNNMQGLEDKYKQHVRAAFELGIYSDRTARPQAAIKIRELLRILAELDKRVKL